MKLQRVIWLVLNGILLVSAGVQDNRIGQPEQFQPVSIPSEDLNVLGPFPSSGSHHFTSSAFPEIDARGFHESVFDGLGDFVPGWSPKRSLVRETENDSYRRRKREASSTQLALQKRSVGGRRRTRGMEMGSVGFHGDAFNTDFGDFVTMRKRRDLAQSRRVRNLLNRLRAEHLIKDLEKRRPEMDSSGFHGDTFGSGFGDFETMKKRRPEMDSMGFHGDTFGSGFGDFETMKKRRPEMDSMGFHGDTFGGGFGEFDTMKKRRPEMDSMGFHGDTFGSGFGDFETMKKRRPEMDSMGFHGDTFGGGFGDFDTMKKRRPEMDSMGFHGDTFGSGFGDFETMKKRRPEMDSMGFHGDTFGGGFGDFDTMKKRRPEMDSMGFHGDTFGSGFGDFETMKKRRQDVESMGLHGNTYRDLGGMKGSVNKESNPK